MSKGKKNGVWETLEVHKASFLFFIAFLQSVYCGKLGLSWQVLFSLLFLRQILSIRNLELPDSCQAAT